MEKIRSCINIDRGVWERAGEELPMSRSAFIEKQLRQYLNEEDDEDKIIQELAKCREKENILKEKLCDIRARKNAKAEEDDSFNRVMNTLNRVYETQGGRVGRNQIVRIARHNDVSPDEVEDFLREREYNIVNFCDVSMADIKEAA